jgi:ParB family chromosome partitioning protein
MSKKLALGKGMASLLQVNNTVESTSSIKMNKNMTELSPSFNKTKDHQSKNSNLLLNKSSDNSDKNNIKEKELRNGEVVFIHLTSIQENPYQPRKHFSEEEILELSKSIKENGLLQPIIVSQVGHTNQFQLIAGERRLRAFKLANFERIPAIVRRTTDQDKLVLAILENIQRSNLNCVEEGFAFKKLMEDFNLTQEEVAKKLGKERSSIANTIRILKLPQNILENIQMNKLTFGHAKILVSLKDNQKVNELSDLIIEKDLSVKDLQRYLDESLQSQRKKNKSENNEQGAGELNKKSGILNEKIDFLKRNLEERTGFHFDVKHNSDGSGKVVINYNDVQEFNGIYEFLLMRK